MEKSIIIHDISMSLYDGMLIYPKDVPYHRYRQRDMDKNDSSNVSAFESTAHVGAHVDSPLHYYRKGYSVDKIPLNHLYGPAYVADCRNTPAVTAAQLQKILPHNTKRLLLKTDNSQKIHDHPDAPFDPNFVYLASDAAQFIADHQMLLVGIDYLSIDKSGQPEKSSHHILLANNVTILEGIDLATVDQGEYFLACGPLKMKGSEGAPARAVLIENLL